MAVLVRSATLSDLDVMIALDPSRRAAMRGWIDAGQACIAMEGASAVGFAVMTQRFFDRGFVELVVVAEAFRRRGIGAALLDHLESCCPTATLWTSTNESNSAMRALLRAAGFALSGQVDRLDENDPELFFRKLVR